MLSVPELVQPRSLVKTRWLLEKEMLVPLYHICLHPGSHPEPRLLGTSLSGS